MSAAPTGSGASRLRETFRRTYRLGKIAATASFPTELTMIPALPARYHGVPFAAAKVATRIVTNAPMEQTA